MLYNFFETIFIYYKYNLNVYKYLIINSLAILYLLDIEIETKSIRF